jgi:hydroxyquinol 1,2-dioxygenase
VFREGAEYLENDVVFGAREGLVARFERHDPGVTPTGETSSKPFHTVRYDFVLAPAVETPIA